MANTKEREIQQVYTQINDKLKKIDSFKKDRFVHRTEEEFLNDSDDYYDIYSEDDLTLIYPEFKKYVEDIKRTIGQMNETDDIDKKNGHFRRLKYDVEEWFEKRYPIARGGQRMSYRSRKMKKHKRSKSHKKIKKGKRTKRRRY